MGEQAGRRWAVATQPVLGEQEKEEEEEEEEEEEKEEEEEEAEEEGTERARESESERVWERSFVDNQEVTEGL